MNSDDKFLDALGDLSNYQEQAEQALNSECRTWWETLSQQDQMKAFYIVTRMIYESEFKDSLSYRGMLYDKFGFPPESYGLGVLAGLMHIHNRILTDKQYQEYREYCLTRLNTDSKTIERNHAGDQDV